VKSIKSAALRNFAYRLVARSSLTENEVGGLLDLDGVLKDVPARTDIMRQGDNVDYCSLVVDGLVAGFRQRKSGARQIIQLSIPGDMTDLSLLMSPSSGWGMSALTRTTVLRIAHADLRRLIMIHPGIVEAFWRDCVVDASLLAEWVVNVGRRDATARVAHLLCEMALRYEQARQGSRRSFTLPATQPDLADATGLTSVHLNRTLAVLRDRAIVSKQAGQVTVHDWGELVATADFNPAYMMLDGPAVPFEL
jgi:CRP-like cAMP-binding protein